MLRRTIRIAFAAAGILFTALLLYAFAEARRDPVVHKITISLPNWPAGAKPVRVALFSDVHIGSAAMNADRLTRIAGQVNALHPDLIVIAGDFINGHADGSAARIGAAMVAPLAKLHAPLGVIAVPGNHDYDTGVDAVEADLRRAHVTVLDNSAVTRGPLAIGGISDDTSKHAALDATVAALRQLPGARVLVTHSPDIAAKMPRDTSLMLAGHTHCGQVVLPLLGPPVETSRYGHRYLCGIVREKHRLVVITGGLGTSEVPFRFGAPPDLWLLTLGPK